MTNQQTTPQFIEGTNADVGLWQVGADVSPFRESRAILLTAPIVNDRNWNSALSNQDRVATASLQIGSSAPKAAEIISVRDEGVRRFVPLADWEAVVEDVQGSTIYCRIAPLSDESNPCIDIQRTEFSLDDLEAVSERAFVVPGAVLYWTVGRSRAATGTVRNESILRVRRLATTVDTEDTALTARAEALFRLFSGR